MTTTATEVEKVLVVPTALFREVGYFQGFSRNAQHYLKTLLDPAYTSYRPRNEMEQDPSFKQLIPYCIFTCGGNVFQYTRGTAQGETRLHNKRSVGIGGHISMVDNNGKSNVYLEGMRREIEEEVVIESGFTESCIGMINDDTTEVGRVHLGVVHVFDLDAPKVRPREESIILSGFVQPSELIRDRGQFETWSQICIQALFGGGGA